MGFGKTNLFSLIVAKKESIDGLLRLHRNKYLVDARAVVIVSLMERDGLLFLRFKTNQRSLSSIPSIRMVAHNRL